MRIDCKSFSRQTQLHVALSSPKPATTWHEIIKIMEQEGLFHLEQPGRAGTEIQAAAK